MSQPYALIIDDNPYNVEILTHLLDLNDVSHVTIEDPTALGQVLPALESPLDVVFLDLELPKEDGYHLLRVLKDEWGLTAPIVAYTVHTSQMREARALGFDGFLGKPLDPQRFAEQLARILAGESVWEIP